MKSLQNGLKSGPAHLPSFQLPLTDWSAVCADLGDDHHHDDYQTDDSIRCLMIIYCFLPAADHHDDADDYNENG